jgi:hypothetical protein
MWRAGPVGVAGKGGAGGVLHWAANRSRVKINNGFNLNGIIGQSRMILGFIKK